MKSLAVDAFSRALASHRVHHCYVLVSPDTALTIESAAAVSALLMETAAMGEKEKSLLRSRIERRIHPDLLWVAPEEKSLKIGDVRGLAEKLAYPPLEAERRVVVLERAESLLTAAANSLLKILEEPPAYAVFLLLTTAEAKLLPTIRSRAQLMRLAPLSAEMLLARLRKRFPMESEAHIQAAVLWANGSLEQAVAWLTNEDLRNFVGGARQTARDLFHSGRGLHSTTLRFLDAVKTAKEAELLLQVWQAEGHAYILAGTNTVRAERLCQSLNREIYRGLVELDFNANPKLTVLGVCAALELDDNRI